MCAKIGPFAGCKIPLMDDLLKTSHWSSQDIFLEQYCNLRLFLTKSFFPPFFHGGQTCIAIWRFSLPPFPSLSVICHRHFIQSISFASNSVLTSLSWKIWTDTAGTESGQRKQVIRWDLQAETDVSEVDTRLGSSVGLRMGPCRVP